MHAHTYDDIEEKGATRNYDTKPNEKAHGPLKFSYQRRTNFKEVAEQVTCFLCLVFNKLLMFFQF